MPTYCDHKAMLYFQAAEDLGNYTSSHPDHKDALYMNSFRVYLLFYYLCVLTCANSPN